MYGTEIYRQLAAIGIRRCIFCTPEDQRTLKLKGARYFLYVLLDWIKLLLGGVKREQSTVTLWASEAKMKESMIYKKHKFLRELVHFSGI